MKTLFAVLFITPVFAFAYPELCMPDHKDTYTAAYADAKTSIDKLWKSSGMTCLEVGYFLDYFEVKEPLPLTATEKDRCQWAGTVQGVALFSQQREQECGAKKCQRPGSYIGRNVAKSFCGLVELYSSDLLDRFMKDLERPVCAVNKEECLNEAEISSSANCRALKAKYPAVWKAVLKQTCA